MRTALVVGASLAGVRTAQALRAQGWQDRVVVVGQEQEQPYDRPPLSKQLLAGLWEPERLRLLEDDAQDGIELRLGVRAVHLDAAAHEVVLADGSRVAYDVLVVATGARARPSPWRPESGLHLLRTLPDALALREALAAPGPVVVVGGGVLGAEVASTARGRGRDVALVDPLPVPAGRLLGDEVGELLGALHRRHGVRTCFGAGVEQVTGRAGDLQVRLTDGEVLPAATVVVSIGAQPLDGWLADSGLVVDDGVVCDDLGRAQGARDVYAAGDVARWYDAAAGTATRVEHWTSAVEQAEAVALAVVHPERATPRTAVPYVWTEQHDWRLQVVGAPTRGARHVVLGDPDADADAARVAVLYADGDRLVGGAAVNWPRGLSLTRRLLAAGEPFAAARERVAAALAR